MNAHSLSTRVRDIATVLEELDRRQLLLANAGKALETKATERWLESTRIHKHLGDDLAAFAGMTLGARLRWLLRGRR
jgi:ATP-dependent exoDNAse (exonuclease V) alpha subunit